MTTAFLLFTGRHRSSPPDPAHFSTGRLSPGGFRTSASSLPGDGGDLLPGLAIGDTSAVSPELDAAMKVELAESPDRGVRRRLAIVIGLIMFAGAALGLPRALRIAASLTVLVAFVCS